MLDKFSMTGYSVQALSNQDPTGTACVNHVLDCGHRMSCLPQSPRLIATDPQGLTEE